MPLEQPNQPLPQFAPVDTKPNYTHDGIRVVEYDTITDAEGKTRIYQRLANGERRLYLTNNGNGNAIQATRKRRKLPDFTGGNMVAAIDDGNGGQIYAQSIIGSVPDISPSLHNRQWGTIWGDGFQSQHRHARGCLLAIPFDEASGQLISDRVNHYQGTLSFATVNGPANTRWIVASDSDSFFGNCFQFLYGNDYIHLNTFDTVTLPQQITFSIWIKGAANSNLATANWVFQGYNPNNGKQTIYLEYDNNYPNTAITQIQAGSFQTGAASANVSMNGFIGYWFHVACTMDATVGTTKLYLNGVLMGTSANNGATSFPASEIWFGNAINSSYPAALGGMKDFRLYNRILTANEIQDIYRYPDELYEQSSLFEKYTVIPPKQSRMQDIVTMTASATVAHNATAALADVVTMNGKGTASYVAKAALTDVVTITPKDTRNTHASATTLTDVVTLTGTATVAHKAKGTLGDIVTITTTGNNKEASNVARLSCIVTLTANPAFAIGGDSLRYYFTGATTNGGAQAAQTGSLGNYRSSTEASRIGFLQSSRVTGMTVLQGSGHNQPGNGSIIAVDSSDASYTGPAGASGASVNLGPGDKSLLVDGSDSSKWVRVNRATGSNFAGLGQLEFVQQFNNLFGMSNAPDSESSAGSSKYRGMMIRNETSTAITNITLWINGGTATAITAGLGASGSGTITAATGTFCGWLPTGWVQIQTSGGSLKEIVYYSAIDSTNSILTVPSAGRAQLGTSATAGASTDKIFQVPPVAIGKETPSNLINGHIQTIANENTTPSGITFNTSLTAGNGISIGTLNPSEMAGVWIWRQMPAGTNATAKVLSSILCSFVVNGTTYNETLEGLFRIAVNALQRYELYVGTDTPPNLSGAATETFTAFPHTTTATFTGTHTYYLVTGARNAYNLFSASTQQIITVTSGTQTNNPPTAPVFVSFTQALAGAFNVKFVYYYNADPVALQADKFAVYFTSDGSDPALASPTLVSLTKVTGVAYLNYTTATFTIPTTGRVMVRTFRSSDSVYSTNTDKYLIVSGNTSFGSPVLNMYWRHIAQQT